MKALSLILKDQNIRDWYELVRIDLPMGMFDERRDKSLCKIIPHLMEAVRDYEIPETTPESETELDGGRLLLRIRFHINEYYAMTDPAKSAAQMKPGVRKSLSETISRLLNVDRILPMFLPHEDALARQSSHKEIALLDEYRQRYARALVMYYLSCHTIEYERSNIEVKDLKSLRNAIQTLSDSLETALDKRLHNNLGLLAALHFTNGRIEASIGEFVAAAVNFKEAINLYQEMSRAYLEKEIEQILEREDQRSRGDDDELRSPRRRQANIIRQRTAWSLYRLARCYYEMGETSLAEKTIKSGLFLIAPEANKRGKALFLCQALTIERSKVTANLEQLRPVTDRLTKSFESCKQLLPSNYRIITAVEIGYAKTYLGEYSEAWDIVRQLLQITNRETVIDPLSRTSEVNDFPSVKENDNTRTPQLDFRVMALATVLLSHWALYGGVDDQEKERLSAASFRAAKRGFQLVQGMDRLEIDGLTLLAQASLCLAACSQEKKIVHLSRAEDYLERAETKMRSLDKRQSVETDIHDVTRSALLQIIHIELAKARHDRYKADFFIREYQRIEKQIKHGFIKVLWDRAVAGLELINHDFIIPEGSSLDIKEMEFLLRDWYIEQKEQGIVRGAKPGEQKKSVRKEELVKATNFSRSTIFEVQKRAADIKKKLKPKKSN